MSKVKDAIVAKYNEMNDSKYTAKEIEFRIEGDLVKVADMSDDAADKVLAALEKE